MGGESDTDDMAGASDYLSMLSSKFDSQESGDELFWDDISHKIANVLLEMENRAQKGQKTDKRTFLSGLFVRDLLLNPEIRKCLHSGSVTFYGCDVRESPLSLGPVDLPLAVDFADCKFGQEIKFDQTRFPSLRFTRCELAKNVDISGVQTAGSLQFVDCEVRGKLDARGVTTGGDFSFKGSVFAPDFEESEKGFTAIDARRCHVDGSLKMNKGFAALGFVDISSAVIHHVLDCEKGTFVAPWHLKACQENMDRAFPERLEKIRSKGDSQDATDKDVARRMERVQKALKALDVFNADIRRSARFAKCHAKGQIRIAESTIGGDLELESAILDSPYWYCFNGDGAKVEGTTFFQNANGRIPHPDNDVDNIERTDHPLPRFSKCRAKEWAKYDDDVWEQCVALAVSKLDDFSNDNRNRPRDTDHVYIRGIVRFNLATLKQGLYFHSVMFDRTAHSRSVDPVAYLDFPRPFMFRPGGDDPILNRDGENSISREKFPCGDIVLDGVDLRHATIGGKFLWADVHMSGRPNEETDPAKDHSITRLTLYMAHADVLASDVMENGCLKSWPKAGFLNLEGFTYDGIDDLASVGKIDEYVHYPRSNWTKQLKKASANAIVALLHRSAAYDSRARFDCRVRNRPWNIGYGFSPQPYTQAAWVFAKAGHYRRAAEIRCAQEQRHLQSLKKTHFLDCHPFHPKHNALKTALSTERRSLTEDCGPSDDLQLQMVEDPCRCLIWVVIPILALTRLLRRGVNGFIQIAVGFGYRPLRAPTILLAMWFVMLILTANMASIGHVKYLNNATNSNMAFVPTVFAADVVVPLVDFQQANFWVVSTEKVTERTLAPSYAKNRTYCDELMDGFKPHKIFVPACWDLNDRHAYGDGSNFADSAKDALIWTVNICIPLFNFLGWILLSLFIASYTPLLKRDGR